MSSTMKELTVLLSVERVQSPAVGGCYIISLPTAATAMTRKAVMVTVFALLCMHLVATHVKPVSHFVLAAEQSPSFGRTVLHVVSQTRPSPQAAVVGLAVQAAPTANAVLHVVSQTRPVPQASVVGLVVQTAVAANAVLQVLGAEPTAVHLVGPPVQSPSAVQPPFNEPLTG